MLIREPWRARGRGLAHQPCQSSRQKHIHLDRFAQHGLSVIVEKSETEGVSRRLGYADADVEAIHFSRFEGVRDWNVNDVILARQPELHVVLEGGWYRGTTEIIVSERDLRYERDRVTSAVSPR
jgi:hypothetical protein